VRELQRVRPEHEVAILNFEVANRAYFAQSINDRGDDFFLEFAQRHRELLSEQDSGVSAYYVLVDEDEIVVGRFNLYEITDGTADVGYRVAEHVSGHGVATTALENLCRIATEELGMRSLTAVTATDNVASQRVLEKAGFVVVGPTTVAGRDGLTYELALASRGQRS
jgi:ribosomal-protein-alanine N-acetyltransferase